MAGEIYVQVTSAEVKRIGKDPGLARELAASRDEGRFSLELFGYHVDAALSYLMDEIESTCLDLAVSLEKSIGDDECPVSLLSAAKVREAAAAMETVTREAFLRAFEKAHCDCQEEVGDEAYDKFRELASFFKEAAGRKRALIKTIY